MAVGDALHWRGTLKSRAQQKLKIGLRVYFLKANGEHAARVFSLKEVDADVGPFVIEKKISFKPITTRALYPGTHHVELVVNGKARGKRSFELVADLPGH